MFNDEILTTILDSRNSATYTVREADGESPDGGDSVRIRTSPVNLGTSSVRWSPSHAVIAAWEPGDGALRGSQRGSRIVSQRDSQHESETFVDETHVVPTTSDLPPSYDEVMAGSSQPSAPYPELSEDDNENQVCEASERRHLLRVYTPISATLFFAFK